MKNEINNGVITNTPKQSGTFGVMPGSSPTRVLVTTALLLGIIIIMSVTPLGFIRLGPTALTIIHIPVIIGSVLLGPIYGGFLGLAFGISSVLNATFAPDATSFAFSPFYSAGELHGNGWSLVIALLPRILTGIVPFFVYKGFQILLKKKYMIISAHVFIILTFFSLTLYKLALLFRSTEGSIALLLDFLVYLMIFIYMTGDAISKEFKFRKEETMPLAMAGLVGSFTNTLLVLSLMHLFFKPQIASVVGTTPSLLYKFILILIATNGVPEAIVASLLTVLICKSVLKSCAKKGEQTVEDKVTDEITSPELLNDGNFQNMNPDYQESDEKENLTDNVDAETVEKIETEIVKNTDPEITL